jgi:hypothetical protein
VSLRNQALCFHARSFGNLCSAWQTKCGSLVLKA